MDPVTLVGAAVGVFETFHRALNTIKPNRENHQRYHQIAAKFQNTEALFREVVRGWDSVPPPLRDLTTVEAQLRSVLESLDIDQRAGFSNFLKRPRHELALDAAETILDDLEIAVNRLHRTTMQRQMTQLESTTQSMQKILLAIAEVFDYPMKAASGEQGTERNINIEAMRAKLRETISANPWLHQPMGDRFCFAFAVLPGNTDGGSVVEPARGRVKIDTGADGNWISTRLLERASVTFTPDDSLGTFLGANRQPFKPRGRVSVTWFSNNEAQTQTSDFFVHENAPFDAILGAGWVLDECLNVFHKPVLPFFRHDMSTAEFNDLKKRQEATKASNDEVAALQRIEKRARRERERQEEAQSRALSRITSPAMLTRRNSSASLSTFPSFVTSRSTPGSSTPGIPAEGSAAAGTESQVPGDNSKGKEKEGSNAVTVP